MTPKPSRLFTAIFLLAALLLTPILRAAPIPGLRNTGVNTNGTLLANGAVDPTWKLIASADPAAPGPNAVVINDTAFPIVAGPWLAGGPNSKWIGPSATQSPGNLAGNYTYRIPFNLTGLLPETAVITVRLSSDNTTTGVLLNGVPTGLSYEGGFNAFSAPLVIDSGFIEGTNTLDIVVNNGGTGANPTGFRCEISGTADTRFPLGSNAQTTFMFTNGFNSGFPEGLILRGGASVVGGYLRLTTNGLQQQGVALIDNLPPLRAVQSFQATFQAALFGGSPTPGQGFSFNLAPIRADSEFWTAWDPETGTPSGLSITFDTFNDGGAEVPAVEVLWQGSVVGHTNFQASATPSGATTVAAALRNVSIRLEADGTLNVSYGSSVLFTNLAVPLDPLFLTGSVWALGARTGAAFDHHWIDNLNVIANLETPPQPPAGHSLNLAGGYLEVRHASEFNVFPFSVSAWVRTSPRQSAQTIVQKSDLTPDGLAGFELSVDNGSIRGEYRPQASGARSMAAGGFIADDNWHWIVFSVGTNGSRLFVDGVQTGLGGPVEPPGPPTNTAPLRIGANALGTNLFFGRIDGVLLWSEELNAGRVSGLYLGAPAIIPARIVAAWSFDEGVGAIASSFEGYDATFKGRADWLPQPAPVSSSSTRRSQLDFAGGWVTVPHAAALNAFPLTIQAWVRTTDTTPEGPGRRDGTRLIEKISDDDRSGYFVSLDRGYVGARIWAGNTKLDIDERAQAAFIADNQWHHVAFTVDSTGARIYVDGALTGTDSSGIGSVGPANTMPLYLGRNSSSPMSPFRGQMDGISIWNASLSAGEIRARMNTRLAGNEPGLVAFYPADEGIGIRLFDATLNQFHGTISGPVFWQDESAPFGIPAEVGLAGTFSGGSFLVPHHTNFNRLPLTILAWIRSTNALTANFITKGTDATTGWFHVGVTNGRAMAGYSGGSPAIVPDAETASTITDGRWHQIAYVVNSNQGVIYLDGVSNEVRLFTTRPGRPNPSSEPLRIGSPQFRGQLDEVSFWNAELVPAAITTYARQRVAGFEPGLIAAYRFNEGGGSGLEDATTNRHDGTLAGSANWTASSLPLIDLGAMRGHVTAFLSGRPDVPMTAYLAPFIGPAGMLIGDTATIELTNRVQAVGPLGVLNLSVNISHPFRGDLELTLIHPDGTLVRLKEPKMSDDGDDWITSYPDRTTPVEDFTDLYGKPMTGDWRLRIRDAFAEDVGLVNGWTISVGPAPVFTDAAGDYEFRELFPGTYTVQPEQPGFDFTPESRTVASGTVGVNFNLLSAFLAGRITNSAGQGQAGVTVSAGSHRTVTDANGDYRLNSLPAGNYTIVPSLRGHGFVPSRLGARLGATNASFAVVSYPISGQVVDSHTNGVRGVTVSAGGRSAVTDGDGHYIIREVPPGFWAVVPQWGDLATFEPANQTVQVTHAIAGINFAVISAPPTITALPDVVVLENTATSPLRFDVADTETRAGLLKLTATSANASVVPAEKIIFGGVGNARTVTVSPNPGAIGSSLITITVTDESGGSSSASFRLRVDAVPLAGSGGALRFDGFFGGASAAPEVIGNKGTFTVECWANAPTNSGPRILVAQGVPTNFFALAINASGNIEVSGRWNSGVPYPYGGWHHLAVVQDVDETRLYVDGESRASRSILPFPSRSSGFFIGTWPGFEARWLGDLDEVRVWNRARTAQEIATNVTTRILGATPDLAALWRFDERADVALQDASGRHPGAIDRVTRIRSSLRFLTYETPEGSPFTDELQAWDPDNDPLTFRIITPPQRGRLVFTGTSPGAFTYTPNANGAGDDRFTFTASDGFAETAVSAVTIRLTPDTNAPVISYVANQTVAEDTTFGPLSFQINDRELPASNLTVTAHCSLPSLVSPEGLVVSGAGTNRMLTIRPVTNAVGSATISLVVSDGKQAATNQFLLTVTPVNDAPVFVTAPTTLVTRRGQPVVQVLAVRDVDHPASSLTVTASSSVPSIVPIVAVTGTGASRTVTATGAATLSGLATITVVVSDGSLSSSTSFSVRVNEPPSIGAVPDQVTYRSVSRVIPVTISDVDTLTLVTLAAGSSNPSIVEASGLTITGTGASRTLTVRPVPSAIGATLITLTASDSYFTTTTTFTLTVEQPPVFEFVELPLPAGAVSATPYDINDVGMAVGAATMSDGGLRPVLWDVRSATPLVSLPFNESGFALAINNRGAFVGQKKSGAGPAAYVFDHGEATILSGNFMATDINDLGATVGPVAFNGAIFYSDGTTQTTLPGNYAVFGGDEHVQVNRSGDVFVVTTNRTNAIVWQLIDGSRSIRNLGSFGGSVAAGALNEVGWACVNVRSNLVWQPIIYDYQNSKIITNLLPALRSVLPGGSFLVRGMNDLGEVVGYDTSVPNGRAFAYLDGRPIALQDLLDQVVPQRALAINQAGDIVGYGTKSGVRTAFLLKRQFLVGQPIDPPSEAINPATGFTYQRPIVEAIDGTPGDQVSSAYFWAPVEQKLYFLQPILARVTWYRTSDLADTNAAPPIVRNMRSVWPADPQIHIAGAPVSLEPLTAASPYRAVNGFSAVEGTRFEPGKTLTATREGYSVIQYVIAPDAPLGSTPDFRIRTNYFQVVRTVNWNDPTVRMDGVPATVGTRVTDPRGLAVSTNSPKSGWVINEIAPYDGVGSDKAYDRDSQTGPIIPVNKDTASRADDDLVVVFYKVNPITGALWPDLPVHYKIGWPTGAPKLVIANQSGSGPLPPAEYPDQRIYVQDDPHLPGFNPNEEHALFAPGQSGEALFALRNDLNSAATSDGPFVLLKYRNPTTGEWAMKAYEVVLTDLDHTLDFTGEAGKEILPPNPINLILCSETKVVQGDPFRDHRGKIYARRGPIGDEQNPRVVLHYYYPLQPTFWYENGRVGQCVSWQAIPSAGAPKADVLVSYRIAWPTNTPALQIGETLLNAKRGLPGVRSWASAQVVFDTLNPEGTTPDASSTRLYDPLSARSLALTDVASLPLGYNFSGINLQPQPDGKQIFPDLPFHLRSRLSYDPVNRLLSWSGFLDDSGLGEPFLLINVMSAGERERIKALSKTADLPAAFETLIDALYDLTRNPNRLDTDGDNVPEKALLIGFTMENGKLIQENLGGLPKALTAGLVVPGGAGAASPTNYLVLAQNNDPALGAGPVDLTVIRIEGGPFRGDLKLIFPDNVFDERLTLRHSSDFGGDPDRLEFEWWYHPDAADFNPTELPIVGPDGTIADARGWRLYRPSAQGQNSVTTGDGGDSSLFTLIDNWFIVRYKGYWFDSQQPWSDWVGDPSSAAETRASFVPGWIKRVIEGINPFEARTTNFHDNAAGTYASMLIQAGNRYEGDIALNPSGDNLNKVGLIETYTTVLNRGKKLSIEGLPPVDMDPANNALLLAASRISDLYMLLGNEAFSDAQDPTIGFFSDSLEFGTVATSIFAFQNQLDSLLEEELTLLRGRDDSASGVGARPVYNRLLWNFTGAAGEVAYERAYNVGDVDLNGVINEFDAKILFPQGHGDAWGHYLTAIKTYYDLLRHPRFTWVPRSETVLVAGTAVRVDFLDERKFATIAAQKAKTGAEVVDLTYRSKYVDDPEGQYQGYKDTKPDRAWGVTEWARRTGQAAYFDWLTGNAILPSTDPNTNHVGIQKIDRQTVLELDEVVSHHRVIQAQLDKVDKGLNPLGLAKGVVPFDVDPSLLLPSSGVQAQGHFEQIYSRAVQAMNNTVTMWNQANSLTEALRRQQDTVDEFTVNVTDQERDFKNRLIEVFGYPYAGDIGPGKTYPSGYDGPDIYKYHYVNATELEGGEPDPRGLSEMTGYFKPFPDGDRPVNFYFGGDLAAENIPGGPLLKVSYPLATSGWAFTATPEFGSRRAPGELQLALSDLLQEETRLKIALKNHAGLIRQIEDMSTLLQSRVALTNRIIDVLTENRTQQISLSQKIVELKNSQLGLRRAASIVTRLADAAKEGIPDASDIVTMIGGMVKFGLLTIATIAAEGMEGEADNQERKQNKHEATKEATQLQSDLDVEIATQDFEVQQMAAELRQLLRSEGPMRLEALTQAELVKQTLGRYQAALAAGERLLHERTIFRQRTAGTAQQNRYKDLAFRIFRNDALQKYRAQFDLAARYVYLAASAYDYELNFLGTDTRGARNFFTDIMRERSLGVMVNGLPITGRTGLSDPLARLKQNYEVLSPRFGLNNPQQETARFSLRKELFRIRDGSDDQWRNILNAAVVPDLWAVPEFRRYCRPFAPETAGPQPGLVLRFPTTVTFGLNFFEHALGGGDTAYDPSLFSTKVNAAGIWFSDYDGAGLARAPRVYLFPAGLDIMRAPSGNALATREYRILDQVVPVPFPIGASDLDDPTWIPINDSLAENFAQIRRYSSFRAYHDLGVYDETQSTKDTRLIGRSVWNSEWVLIIPGGTLLNDPQQGLKQFINSVSDILVSLQSYSYSGD